MQQVDDIHSQLYTTVCRFFEEIKEDARISSVHISLFMALLHTCLIEGEINPVKINRRRLMDAAKISARQTFNKRINELHQYGYIYYHPCSNQFHPSLIYLKYIEDSSLDSFKNQHTSSK